MYFGVLARASCTSVPFTTSLVTEFSSKIDISLHPLLESLYSKNGKASWNAFVNIFICMAFH
jgi:hypothetical protein